MKELHLTDPAKIKAATTYNSAAEHFDDAPLAFWELYGRRTVDRLNLKCGSTVLDVGCRGASCSPDKFTHFKPRGRRARQSG